MQGVELILITQEKICKVCITSKETAVLWSESSENGGSPIKDNVTPDKGFKGGQSDNLENRIKSIFEMMNGKIPKNIVISKPMFGNA